MDIQTKLIAGEVEIGLNMWTCTVTEENNPETKIYIEGHSAEHVHSIAEHICNLPMYSKHFSKLICDECEDQSFCEKECFCIKKIRNYESKK